MRCLLLCALCACAESPFADPLGDDGVITGLSPLMAAIHLPWVTVPNDDMSADAPLVMKLSAPRLVAFFADGQRRDGVKVRVSKCAAIETGTSPIDCLSDGSDEILAEGEAHRVGAVQSYELDLDSRYTFDPTVIVTATVDNERATQVVSTTRLLINAVPFLLTLDSFVPSPVDSNIIPAGTYGLTVTVDFNIYCTEGCRILLGTERSISVGTDKYVQGYFAGTYAGGVAIDADSTLLLVDQDNGVVWAYQFVTTQSR